MNNQLKSENLVQHAKETVSIEDILYKALKKNGPTLDIGFRALTK